ncbi:MULTISPECIES: magnesium transporter [unclassified Exiguobacterium]|uniref:magnesium transporter n=1 Tax=unclassified Exiguobacterium TaxID=2644629 RepID=UPI00103B125D|nr:MULTISPECIES: magnesium transporter [unclassified Exiguobacterium]TCI48534.1 magnesium transporter [Exiguobacterium sp. SH5S32]TCI55421.1 magnesium transporter [Exiguobacterium sp. SH1S4]TCI75215.1 magnesium transporter [Exiguobacterium sp. SH1S1]
MAIERTERARHEAQVTALIQKGDPVDFRDVFLTLHPGEQADIFIELNQPDRAFVYSALSPEEYTDLFEKLELDEQQQFIQEMPRPYAVSVLNDMFSDNAADLMTELPDDFMNELFEQMDETEATEVKDLMRYPDDTAGAIMTTEFIVLQADKTIGATLEELRDLGPEAETIYYLYVIDVDRRLVGVVSLRDLIVSPLDHLIADIMGRRVVSAHVMADQEDLARTVQKYDLLALPVIDSDDHLLGIITVDDVMDVIERETTEDFEELSATKGSSDINMGPVEAAKKRAPWIISLMFLGMITASTIGGFEDTLETIVLLAVFMPLVMGSAGNAATQSLVVAVRSIALGTINRKNVAKMIRREFGTGVLLGLACMVVIFGVITVLYDSALIGIIVGLSIFASLSVATIVGTLVPLLINRLKLDPAVASGPFITTVVDNLGLIIYFTVATSLLRFF